MTQIGYLTPPSHIIQLSHVTYLHYPAIPRLPAILSGYPVSSRPAAARLGPCPWRQTSYTPISRTRAPQTGSESDWTGRRHLAADRARGRNTPRGVSRPSPGRRLAAEMRQRMIAAMSLDDRCGFYPRSIP